MMDGYETDDELAIRLGRALAQVDPVPSSVVAAAKASGTWRTFDTELALLVYDSVLDTNELAGVRGGGSRLLTFASPDVTVELEVLGGHRGLIGQITGVTPTRVEICSGDGSTVTEPDAVGNFACPSLRPGAVSVRATDDVNGTVIQTEWVVI